MEFRIYRGFQIEEVADALARLRITIFKDFPYLYDGDMAYEQEYLKTYINSPSSLVFIVLEDAEIIGATTCIPIMDETQEVQAPFLKLGYDLSKIIYFGESILLKKYRGRGIGNIFFDTREKYARSLEFFELICFCAVQRPSSHPLTPHNYNPLDNFWLSRGYNKSEELKTEFSWRDLGESTETQKTMQFWVKKI